MLLTRSTTTAWLALLSASLASCGGSSEGGSSGSADTMYVNAKVLTVNQDNAVAQAFAVKDGKFIAVGTPDFVRQYASSATTTIDLQGQTVMPGITDNHIHGVGGGPGIDLSKTRSIAELLAQISAAVAKTPANAILQSNADWHEAQLKEVRMPTLAELDAVAPNHPLVLHRGGLTAMVNSAALRLWNITPATQSPPGGIIAHDSQGKPTGLLINNARSLMSLPPMTAFTENDLLQIQYKLNSLGVTSVRVPGMFTGTTVPEAYGLIRQLQKAGKLSVRYQLLLNSMAPVSTVEEVKKIMTASHLAQSEGDPWARIWGVKTSVDGGFEGGYMTKPYAEPFGKGGTFYGLPLVNESAYEAVSREWAKNGYRMAVHVVGDAALEEVLNAWEKIDKDKPGSVKGWTIEHAFVVQPQQIARVKTLGLELSVQAHLYVAAPVLSNYWGHDRAEHVTPVQTFLKAGFALAGGTDSANMPVNPFWAMYHFITRDTINAGVYGASERASRQDVLRMFTINNARLNGESTVLGSIETGKLADFVVLSGDILTIPEKAIEGLTAQATYVAGKQVYRDPTGKIGAQ